MVVCLTRLPDGAAGGGFGRAHEVVVAHLADGKIDGQQVHEVRWDELHDQRADDLHHADIARFLKAQGVELVATGHMGPGMVRMLGSMGIEVRTGVEGTTDAVLGELARTTA